MKILVTGSRHYSNRRELHFWLSLFPISEIIHGGCRGADQLAADYALECNIPLEDSKGTFDCIRRAKKSGIPVLEVRNGKASPSL